MRNGTAGKVVESLRRVVQHLSGIAAPPRPAHEIRELGGLLALGQRLVSVKPGMAGFVRQGRGLAGGRTAHLLRTLEHQARVRLDDV